MVRQGFAKVITCVPHPTRREKAAAFFSPSLAACGGQPSLSKKTFEKPCTGRANVFALACEKL
jgi:hypothetical protein